MTRFLCISDQQLDAGDYEREPGDRLREQEAVWERALALAAEHDVDAVIHAGDAFEYRRPTPAALLAFQRPLQAFVAEHDIPVLAINGNHDLEHGEKPSALTLFERDLDLHATPDVWWETDVAVCTLPWQPVARLRAARDGGPHEETNALAASLLLQIAGELRERVAGPAILLAHWHVDSATTMAGKGASELFREPLLDYGALEGLGFAAMVFGHNHLSQILGPTGFHVGSPMPVNFGEANAPHGVWLLDVAEGPTVAKFLPIESRPFVTVGLSIDEALGYSLDSDEDVTDAVVRVRYTATEEQARRIDHAGLTASLYEAGAHRVHSIQPTIVRENRARIEGVTEEIAPLAAVGAWCDANGVDDHAPLADLTARYLQDVVA